MYERRKECPICGEELIELYSGEASCPRCGNLAKYNPYTDRWEKKY